VNSWRAVNFSRMQRSTNRKKRETMSNGKVVKRRDDRHFRVSYVTVLVFDQPGRRDCKVSFLSAKKYPIPWPSWYSTRSTISWTLTLKDTWRAGAAVAETEAKAQVAEEDESSLSLIWDTLFNKGTKDLAEKPVRNHGSAKYFVEPGDPVTKARISCFTRSVLLPVLEDKKNLWDWPDDRGISIRYPIQSWRNRRGKWTDKEHKHQKVTQPPPR